MKRTLLTLLAAGILSLNSCSDRTDNNEIKILENKINSKMTVHETGKKVYLSDEEAITLKDVCKNNEEYLQSFLENSEFFNNHFNLSQAITNILKNKEHTYRTENNYKNTILTEQLSQVYDLSLSQNQRIYLMLKSLKDSSFLNKIGNIIDQDVQDKYSEHGGIITLSPKLKLDLITVESENKKDKMEENNKFYSLQEWANFVPNLAKFHLHATSYNEANFAGPGKQDRVISESVVDFGGASHEFIITPLRKGRFNIDYIGGDKLLNRSPKVIDLGNYDYDSTKINFK